MTSTTMLPPRAHFAQNVAWTPREIRVWLDRLSDLSETDYRRLVEFHMRRYPAITAGELEAEFVRIICGDEETTKAPSLESVVLAVVGVSNVSKAELTGVATGAGYVRGKEVRDAIIERLGEPVPVKLFKQVVGDMIESGALVQEGEPGDRLRLVRG